MTACSTKAEVVTVGGTGSAGPLIQILFEEFQKQVPEVSMHLINPPLGTNGSLIALETGRIDLALLGRSLPPEETSKFGQRLHIADTPFVMASLDGQRKNGFTLEELAKVYEGALQTWDTGAPIRLVVRGNLECEALVLKSMSTGIENAFELATKRPGMVRIANDIGMAQVIASTSIWQWSFRNNRILQQPAL